jgi:hypothetical protein
MHQLIIDDRDFGDESGNVRRDRSAVAADIGVIGALDEAAGGPPILAIPRGSAGNGEGADDEGRSSGYPPQRNVLDAAGWLETDTVPCIAASVSCIAPI